jgi:hypothetical protein
MGARTTSKTIRDLLAHLDDNELVLPEIQREFVWSRKAVMMLFDSLYRGLPIGHMLIWKARRAVIERSLSGHPKRKERVHHRFYGYLLDGQQRLTALKLVRDGDDEYRLLLNLWPDAQKYPDYADLFYWSGSRADDDPWLLPVSDLLQDGFDPLAYLNRLRQDEYYEERFEKEAFQRLTALQKILDYSIGVTEFESDSYEEATELFIRFNSMGRKLNKSDLAMAQLALKVPGLGARDINRAMEAWAPAFRFTRPFLVQCLAAVHTGRMALKESRLFRWDGATEAEIRRSWNRTEKAMSAVVEFLTGVVHWDSAVWVPSFNALIPLIFLSSRGERITERQSELARTWLILTTVRGYFSGAVHTQLDRLLRKLDDKATVKQLWDSSRKRLAKIRPDDFETNRISGAVMAMFVSMIRNAGAKDWKKPVALDGTVLGNDARLQIHHFFPRALLRREKYPTSEIDTFANYTLLSRSTNLHISTEEPATYLQREKVGEPDVDKQCIPLNRDLWRVGRYEDFIDVRRKLLAQRANDFLDL